ncbi:ribonuclease E inhibitor RraB [Pseudomonas sp. S31]|uniref:ribonuclease E inhibitor RraB n=1 Tax=Pseudomonas sp. S31 TaxID=1564473 RepID=UPI001914B66A|nr:ribonuclease E inhibitor RraB [Pseudomonas sp. S31]MBK4999732.1 ribonuclease E inhibitor RraB [Pseudomonas sp. S31]
MAILEDLMNQVPADIDVLISLDSQGDDFSTQRDVDFVFYAKELRQGEAAVGFINDFRFGAAKLETVSEEQHRIRVTLHSQVTQEVILCLSGYMACLAHLFDLDYDGWGCIAQRPA